MRSNYIGLMVEDTPSLLIGLMSILKTGNCVVPINPVFPDDRIRYIVEDCRVRAILTDRVNHDRVREAVRGSTCLKQVICIDEIDFESRTDAPAEKEESRGKAAAAWQHPPIDQPCYLIYTSGSTGKPKGVQITNRNLVPLLSWFLDYFKLGKHTRVLQSLSYTFDFGIFELITTLLGGGGLYFLDRKMLSGLDEYVDFIHRHRIETIHTTPSFFTDVIGIGRSLAPLRLLHFGGERLTGKIVEAVSQLVGADCYIYNGYGPTETTINSAIYSIRAGDLRENPGNRKSEVPANIPIGKPSANNIIYILDAHGNLQPLGVVGELYIGGTGVAGGYLNNPELTAEKFIVPSATKNPFEKGFLDFPKLLFNHHSPLTTLPLTTHHSPLTTHHSPIYRTGDLVRWLRDGNVEFLGRIDHQVKIRGFRIELGEIEGRMLEYGNIKEAAVIEGKWENRDTYLCAYIVPDAGFDAGGGIKALKEFLMEVLPDYMIPSAFMVLERMPLSTNQKIDRKALPRPEIGMEEKQFIPPRNRTEETLAVIWSEVLGIEKARIGIDGNFFELGGHSLKATALTGKIYKTLEVRIPLVEIFKTPTIRELAQRIEAAAKERYRAIDPVEKREYYPLSSAQMRLYLLNRIDTQSTGYHISTAMTLEGDIREEGLEEVFKRLIRRHESFRTSFRVVEEEPVQVIHDEVSFVIEYHDIATEGTERENYKLQNTNYKQIPNSKSQITNQEVPSGGCGAPGLLGAFGEESLVKCQGRGEVSSPIGIEKIIGNFIRPFDLTKAPLLRVGLVRFPAVGTRTTGYFLLMVDMHHIVSDGVSMGIILGEFMSLYRGEELPGLKYRYKDYSGWQNREISRGGITKQEQYWFRQMGGEIPRLNLPADFVRPAVQTFAGGGLSFEIGGGETGGLKNLALTGNTTLFMLLLGIFNIFLAKLSSQEEILVGTPVAGRKHPDLGHIVGMFVNTLALRNQPAAQKTVKEFLKEVARDALEAFENQDYPFESLVDKVKVERDPGRNPLFDVMLVLRNMWIPSFNVPGLKMTPYLYEGTTSKFDMTLYLEEREDFLQGYMEYSSDLFKTSTVERFIAYFNRLVALVSKPFSQEMEIGEIEIITGDEKEQLLVEFNQTARPLPMEKTLVDLFIEQEEQIPDRVALVGPKLSTAGIGNISVTYREMHERSDRWAVGLKEEGVQPGTIVGLMVTRSLDMIIGLYAILKVGGAYLPIDPEYPVERIHYMLSDSRAGVLVTAGEFPGEYGEVKVFDILREECDMVRDNRGHRFYRANSSYNPSALFYVIYTSGSTGRPKGAFVQVRGFGNLVEWYIREFALKGEDRYLLIAPVGFDLAQKNLYAPLVTGGCLCIAAPGLPDYDELSRFIAHEQQSVINCAPSVFYPFVQLNSDEGFKKLKSLRYIFLGGEPIQMDRLVPWLNSGSCRCEIVNTYGPTECTDVVSWYRIPVEAGLRPGVIPIGRPVDHVRLYVLDKRLKVLPMGFPGEVCIGGIGVGPGYCNNVELTAEKFIKAVNGHSSLVIGKPKRAVIGSSTNDQCPMTNDRLYKTGDLGRWVPGGNIEFLGRMDYQVKIRGLRIELGEIEKRLLGHPVVKEVVVVAIADEARGNYLCAYIVPVSGGGQGEIPVSALKEYLAGRLPVYMVPSYFVAMGALPLTPSGKVDRKLLPRPRLETGKGDYTAASTITEINLTALWSEVLGIEKTRMGIDGNFFEIGGHSLKATTLISRIYKALDVKIPLVEIFKSPTIRQLARYIDAAVKERYQAINPVEKREYYSLSPAQRRLYLLNRIDAKGIGYNIPAVTEWEGDIQKERLEKVFRQLVRRHESFRTSFREVEGEPVQVIHDEVSFVIEYYDKATEGTGGINYKLQNTNYKQIPNSKSQMTNQEVPFGHLSNASGENDSLTLTQNTNTIIKSFIRPFDLAKAPLLRVGLVRNPSVGSQASDHFFLLVDMHHIIADGTSTNVLISDFTAIYNGEELSPQVIQYKDFTRWQNSKTQREKLEAREKYWLNTFDRETPVLDMPLDFPRPVHQDFTGKTVKFTLGELETAKLNALAEEQGATLFMVLLAVYNVMLAKLSGQEEIVVGVPVAGRRHDQLERIIGMFINTLALRSYLPGWKSFKGFLKEVKEGTLAAFENQDYPFEELVEKINIKRDTGRNPLFDVMFVMQNIDHPAESRGVTAGDLKFKTVEYENGISKFDMTFVSRESGEDRKTLEFTVEYGSRLFKPETIHRYTGYFKRVAAVVTEKPDIEISALEMVPGEEKRRLVLEFNSLDPGFPTDRTLHGLFARQVEWGPQRIALVGDYESSTPPSTLISLTYKELDRESDRLAHELFERGVKPGAIVGLQVNRSVEMIIGILGILKAGAAYLPLNPKNPAGRTRYMLEDSSVKILVSDRDAVGTGHCPVLILDLIYMVHDELGLKTGQCTVSKNPFIGSPRRGPCRVGSANLAYVIYTSGTTGKPKGVAITHGNLSPLLHWGYKYLRLTPADRTLQNLSYYFDWSVWEIFIALTTGGGLHMIPEEIVMDPEGQQRYIQRYCITVLHITPTHWQALVNAGGEGARHALGSLRRIAIGAEKLTYDLVSRTYEMVMPGCRVFNMYGPTEATIMSAVLEIEKGNLEKYKTLTSVPIGTTIANGKLLVLDRNMKVRPQGAVGELYIGGDGLAPGYLNNPELTAEKFVMSDRSDRSDQSDRDDNRSYRSNRSYKTYTRLYRTGDLSRWVLGGYIEFLGRIDHQVKIRGYRIELGEIENRLLEYPSIKEAAVMERRWENRESYLCAYIVPAADFEERGGIKAMKEFLSGVLPDYMVPSAFVTMERMPLNPNKKIDRKALPEPTNLGTGREYIPPRDETERKLSLLWAKILNLTSTGGEGIGANTDFFEIGGHSLKVLNLVNAIEKEFRVKVEFQEIFQYSTLGGQAELVRRGETVGHREIPAQSEKEYYELSYTQRRLWLLNQLEPGSPAFNLGGRIVLEEEVDEAVIRGVLAVMAKRHESIRTYFKIIGGEPVQVLRPAMEIHLEKVDLSAYPPAEIEKQRQQLLAQESKVPFDLEKPPLMRTKLVKWGDERNDLLFTMHHIIADGWSLEVLEREFLKLYESRKTGRECEMPEQRLRYKDYAVWHNRLLSDETGREAAKDFWKSQLAGETGILQLPYDHPPTGTNRSGAAYRLVIPGAVIRGLHVLAREHKASLFMVLISGFIRLWHEITGQDDILLGIPGAGRQHDGLENIIGLFVNTLIVKSRVDPGETFHDLLERVQKNLVQVLEYQDIPLELICKELKIKYPEIRVFFNMFTFGNAAKAYLSSRGTNHIEEVQEVKFDLECYLSEYRNGVEIDTHYARELFNPVTIEKILQKYLDILEGISLGRGDKSRKQKRKIKKAAEPQVKN